MMETAKVQVSTGRRSFLWKGEGASWSEGPSLSLLSERRRLTAPCLVIQRISGFNNSVQKKTRKEIGIKK